MAFSANSLAILRDVFSYMIIGDAVELPVDSNRVIQELATVAVAEGFSTSVGLFNRRMKNRPISTLVKFIAYAGGSGLNITPSQPGSE